MLYIATTSRLEGLTKLKTKKQNKMEKKKRQFANVILSSLHASVVR